MPTRKAHAEWKGPIDSGKGKMAFGSGAFEGPYSFQIAHGGRLRARTRRS